MKVVEMSIVGALYASGVAAGLGVLHAVGKPDPTVSLIVGAAVATLAAAFLYGRRTRRQAGTVVKAKVGAFLAVLCLGVSVLWHLTWGMGTPHATIATCVAATFVFPIVLFGSMELIFIPHTARRK